jgi:hypothetical protein
MKSASLALALCALASAPAHAQPASPDAAAAAAPAAAPAPTPAPARSVTPPPADLQSPEQRSLRYSAYTLPARRWAFNLGALGIGGGDAFATLGAAYGIGAGLQVDVNLAHMSVGLLNIGTAWHFIDTRYFDLGARVGFWYGRGKWFWIARGLAKEAVSKIDVMSIPVELTASAPLTRWLELDAGVTYTYGHVYGSLGSEDNAFLEAELGAYQLAFRPGTRLFIGDGTALEFFAKLPAFTTVPLERAKDIKVPFKHTWSMEGGLRSRFAPGLFGSVRLHYGAVADLLYGARLYPAFELELRL